MIRYSLHIDQARSLIFGLNLSEAILTDYLSKTIGRNWVETIQVKGINYHWISRNKIIEEIPLLTDKPDTIYNILKSLKDKGVILYVKDGNKDLVRMTDDADEWGKQIKDSENFPTLKKRSEKNPNKLGNISENSNKNSENFPTNKEALLEGKEKGSENVQHPHPISSPNDLETDGIEKHPTEIPKANNTSKPSGGGLNLKTSNIQNPHAPIDIAKVGRDMFELLRKKFPKDEMDNFLNSVDIDLPTLSNMFAEYWVFEKKRTFNKGESTGVFNSFRSWMSIAKGKEIPEKEVKEGLHTNPLMDKIVEAIKKRKLMQFTPQDAQKVNKFIRETNPSEPALRDGTDSFLAGQGKEWDHWIKAVKGAIQREQMGEL